MRTHNELKFSIVERNFSNFVSWLTDSGAVMVRQEFCAKRYYRSMKEGAPGRGMPLFAAERKEAVGDKEKTDCHGRDAPSQ